MIKIIRGIRNSEKFEEISLKKKKNDIWSRKMNSERSLTSAPTQYEDLA